MYHDEFYSKTFSQQYFACERFILLYWYIATNRKEQNYNDGIVIRIIENKNVIRYCHSYSSIVETNDMKELILLCYTEDKNT